MVDLPVDPLNPTARLRTAAASTPLLTVIVPLLNEREVLPTLHARISAAVAPLKAPVELLFIDDGSSDGSSDVLRELAQADDRVALIRFSRNFGKEQAMSAGLMAARGEAVVILDADLQHPPEHIPEMVAAWRAGADIVNMKRRSRADETWAKRQAAGLFYRLINGLSDTRIPADIGDFRLLSRRAVQALNALPERGRFMKGLFAWIGFPQVTLDYDVAERAAGATKWSPRQLTRFAVEGITAFSIQPLKFATKIGLLAAAIAVLLALYYLTRALAYGDPVPGFPTLIVVILMLGGVQLMAIGVLGEYLGRMWIESKQRPLYIVQDHWPARAFGAAAAALEGGVDVGVEAGGCAGVGAIGQSLAGMLQALGLEVTAVRTAEAPPVDGVRMCTYARLATVLPQTDWLILACPLTDTTRGLVDAELMGALPRGAHLINVARGEVVDEAALIQALQCGHLGGAFLDVFSREPLPPESELWALPGVIVTPHGAGHSDGNESRVAEIFLGNLARWMQGQPMLNRVA